VKMMEELSQINGIPRYIQIREDLMAKIQQKELRTGDQLPTEDELAREFNVSRMTVRQALGDLVQEGILKRQRGVGTFVMSQHMTRHYTRLTSFYEEAIQQGLNPSSQVIELKTSTADKEIARTLNLQIGDRVYKIKRLRLLNDEPIGLNLVWMPFNLFPDLTKHDLEGSLYHYYDAHHVPVVWAKQRIEARLATTDQAHYLKVAHNAAILFSERITYSTNDLPIERVEAFASGAPYSIEITLYREGN